MRKKIILGTILPLCLSFIVLAACVAPAFASTPFYDHASGGGAVIIDIADHQPRFKIELDHFDRGDHGVGDCIWVSSWQYVPPLGRSVWKPVAVVTDSPSIEAFNKDVLSAGFVLLVKHWELQVLRVGKTVLAYWTVPIVSPALTLPPMCLLLRGYGLAQTKHSVLTLPKGVTWTMDVTYFAASATLVCPAWKYCGAVGDQDTSMHIGLDMNVVAPA